MHNSDQQESAVMMFLDKEHQMEYTRILSKMSSTNAQHASFAYLVSFVKAPIGDCFDFEKDSIKTDMFECSWATGMSRSVLTLAQNLWDSTIPADVSDVFGYVDDVYAEFLYYAIQIRFGYAPYFLCI